MLSSKLEFLGVFAFVLCISLATGLKCYQCGPTTTSMEDCAKSQKEQDCKGLTEPRCSTLTMEFKVGSLETKSYAKSCTTKAICDAAGPIKACKAVSGGKCEYKCCEKDLCNKGTSPMVSILLMVSCAAVGFFRFV